MTDRYLVPPLGGLATAVSTITGQEVVETLWAIDQLSRVAAFTLADGAEVVAKARPWEPRLEACGRAQSKGCRLGYSMSSADGVRHYRRLGGRGRGASARR